MRDTGGMGPESIPAGPRKGRVGVAALTPGGKMVGFDAGFTPAGTTKTELVTTTTRADGSEPTTTTRTLINRRRMRWPNFGILREAANGNQPAAEALATFANSPADAEPDAAVPPENPPVPPSNDYETPVIVVEPAVEAPTATAAGGEPPEPPRPPEDPDEPNSHDDDTTPPAAEAAPVVEPQMETAEPVTMEQLQAQIKNLEALVAALQQEVASLTAAPQQRRRSRGNGARSQSASGPTVIENPTSGVDKAESASAAESVETVVSETTPVAPEQDEADAELQAHREVAEQRMDNEALRTEVEGLRSELAATNQRLEAVGSALARLTEQLSNKGIAGIDLTKVIALLMGAGFAGALGTAGQMAKDGQSPSTA